MINRNTLLTLIFLCLVVSITSCHNKKKSPSKTTSKTVANTSQAPKAMANPEQSLREAALEGKTQLALSVLEEVTKVNATDEEGHTALMLAAYNGHTSIVEALLKKNAKINLVDHRGLSALHFASSGPFPATVEILLKHGADINAPDQIEQFTPLMYAASEGHIDVVKILLHHGADTSLKDVDGDTAEKFALQNKHAEIAQILKNQASK